MASLTNVPQTTDPEPERIPHPASAMTLHEAVTTRHSSRAFLPTPVPTPVLHRALSLAAAYSPSNSNVQPWRLWLLTGTALADLKTQLTQHARSSGEHPNIPALPAWAAKYRSQLARVVYDEGWAIARNDAAGRREAVLRNFGFFGAPVAGIVCMRDDLGAADAVSVGIYLQTLVLALRAEGVDNCVQVSIAGYPEVVRKVVGIPRDMEVICGLAIGYEDPGERVNQMRPPRMAWEETTVVVSD